MIVEKYLEPLFQKLKREIYQRKYNDARETFRQILDLESDIKLLKISTRINITSIPLSEMGNVMKLLDEWYRY